ncbi:hypothetical protein MTsPCn5_16790 [Croceitalea sp. MTPC5]|uniref:hypothetical protein n=1 Tax=Croceitalea sp. MTPC5 TaxID=3056565 RepID=UPI002B3E4E4B|nr:hypothetical protein MTsPCn5_16790 [Croceitalea sp. MTPC5]
MKTDVGSFGTLQTKILLFLRVLIFLPKILFRAIILLTKGKRLELHFFKPDSIYCVDGTLNQLSWNVENAIIIIPENSSKPYFGPNEQVFKVDHRKKQFSLTCYGVGNKIKTTTSIKVIQLGVKNFGETSLKNPPLKLKNNSFRIAEENLDPAKTLLKSNPVRLQLKVPQKIRTITDVHILNQLSRLQKVQTLQELKDLEKKTNKTNTYDKRLL